MATRRYPDPRIEQSTPAFEHGFWWGVGMSTLMWVVLYCLLLAPEVW